MRLFNIENTSLGEIRLLPLTKIIKNKQRVRVICIYTYINIFNDSIFDNDEHYKIHQNIQFVIAMNVSIVVH